MACEARHGELQPRTQTYTRNPGLAWAAVEVRVRHASKQLDPPFFIMPSTGQLKQG